MYKNFKISNHLRMDALKVIKIPTKSNKTCTEFILYIAISLAIVLSYVNSCTA